MFSEFQRTRIESKTEVPHRLKTNRLIFDLHGCLLHPKGNFPPEYIDRGLVDEEISLFKKLNHHKDISHLFRLTTPISKIEINGDSLKDKNKIDPDRQRYIDRYDVPDEILESFKQNKKSLESLNAKITIASGTPGQYRDEVAAKLKENNVWDALDPINTAFLNPAMEVGEEIWPTKRIYSVVSKISAISICNLLDGTTPWVVEDTLEIAEYVAAIFKTKVFVPLTYQEAVTRKKFDTPIDIRKNLEQGEIYFGCSVPDILEIYKEHLFHRKAL